jgi:hypothetical protein
MNDIEEYTIDLNKLTINENADIENSSIEDIDLNKLTIRENPEYDILLENLNVLNDYNSKIINKTSDDLQSFINDIYTQNELYLTKISFNATDYMNCDNLPDFNQEQIDILTNIKNHLQIIDELIEDLPQNIKMWSLNIVYDILNKTYFTYTEIVKII